MGEAGVDFMTAGAGADTMIANDGERDTIDCGTNPAGSPDSVTRDAAETSVRNCENSQVGKLVAEGARQHRRRQLDAPEGVEEAALGHRPRARRPARDRHRQDRPAR